MSLDISLARLWTRCPAVGPFTNAVCRVGPGQWLCDLSWACKAPGVNVVAASFLSEEASEKVRGVQYGVTCEFSNGILRVADPGDPMLSNFHVLGALKHVDQDSFDGVTLVNDAGATQFNLQVLANIRDELVAMLEATLSEAPETRPSPGLCSACPGSWACPDAELATAPVDFLS